MEDMMTLSDGRVDLPIFIHSELDDVPLTSRAFRVYAHLARRAGRTNDAWPSYRTIGEKCFRQDLPDASSDTLRRIAIAAVDELVQAGLIAKATTKNELGAHKTNHYALTPKSLWQVKGSDGGSLGGDPPSLSGDNAPKGTTNKGSSNNSSSGIPWQQVALAYESNIGMFTPITSEMVRSAYEEYGGQWIIDAIAIATKRNKRNWSYVEGILRRWKADGRDESSDENPAYALTDTLTDIFRWRARIEKGSDRRALNDLRGAAVQLYDMGYTTVEAIEQLFAAWKKETGHSYPWTVSQFISFASAALATPEEEKEGHNGNSHRGRGSRNGRSTNSGKTLALDYTALAREAQSQLNLPEIDLDEVLPDL